MVFLVALLSVRQDVSLVPAPGLLLAELPHIERRIEIDTKSQTLVAWVGESPVFKFRCSTGRRNGTPKGKFPIRQKLRFNRALPEFGGTPIPYSLRLDVVKGGRRRLIAIHAHPSVPNYPASHGCVRLRTSDAAKLFEWATIGDRVVIR